MLPEAPTLLDYSGAVLRRRRLVILCIVTFAGLAFAMAVMTPRQFRAEAVVFVPSQTVSYGSLLAQAGISLPIPELPIGSVDYVIAVLRSRLLAQAVVEEVDFPYPPRPRRAAGQTIGAPDERVAHLQRATTVRGRNGLIAIAVDAPNPALAMRAANSYVRLLGRYVQKRSTRRREFVETQLEDVQAALRSAEEGYRRFQDREGVVAFDAGLQETVKALADLEAEAAKTAAAVEENARMVQETGSLTEIATLQTKHAGLLGRQAELKRLIHGLKRRLEAAPSQALEAARLRREVELQARRYSLLMEQHQLARIAEQQEESLFQSIDTAVLPQRPVRPRPLMNAALGVTLGMLVGGAAAILLESRKTALVPMKRPEAGSDTYARRSDTI